MLALFKKLVKREVTPVYVVTMCALWALAIIAVFGSGCWSLIRSGLLGADYVEYINRQSYYCPSYETYLSCSGPAVIVSAICAFFFAALAGQMTHHVCDWIKKMHR